MYRNYADIMGPSSSDSKCKSVLWSDEFTFQIDFGNHDLHVLQAKEDKDFSNCCNCMFKACICDGVWVY